MIYQPVVDAPSRRMIGAEALVRWAHPTLGPLTPDAFVPQVEDSPEIELLSTFTVAAALDQAVRWAAAGRRLRMSVNVSARVVGDQRLLDRLVEAIRRRGLDPTTITLEVTESAFTEGSAGQVLGAAREFGVRLSLDDFGTGYASLSRLREFRFDELKIDRSFIRSLATSVADRAMVRSVLDLGHRLGLEVVAEGVEDAATARVLVDLGCDLLQGYLFGCPMPAEELPYDVPPGPRVWPVTAGEPARQAAVDDLGPAEVDDPVLADLAETTRSLLEARSAMVTIIDGDRQQFLAASNVTLAGMAREDAFCAHTVVADSLLEVADASTDRRFRDLWYVAGPPHIRFYAGVALRTEASEAVGTLCVLGEQPRTLTDDERALLERLGRITMARLEGRQRDHLLQRLTSALTELAALNRISELPSAVTTFLRASVDLLDADGAVLLLGERTGGVRLRPVGGFSDGAPYPVPEVVIDARDSPSLERVLTSRQAEFLASPQPASAFERRMVASQQVHSSFLLPISAGSSAVGVLVVYWRTHQRALPTAWRGLAQLMGDAAGSTVGRLQTLEELRVAADSDELTGLCNRRGFLRRATSLGPGTALLMFDLDHFKALNDQHGHATGDEALVAFTAMLTGSLRRDDVGVRWGGEEFVVAVPDLGATGAAGLLRRLRASWTGAGLGLTYSGGGAVLGPTETVEDAIRRADAALYRAKAAGRDRDVLT